MPQCCFAMRALKRTTEPAALDLPWEFGFGRFGFGTLNAASAIWVWQRFVCILCPNLKHHTSGIWHGLMVYIGSVLVYSIYILGCTVSVFGVEYAALLLLVLLLLPLSQEPSHLVTAAGDHQHHQHHLNHQQHLHHQQQRHQHPRP